MGKSLTLKGKVLFIGIGFYDYDYIIKNEIEQLGYNVDYYRETEELTGFSRFSKKFLKSGNELFINASNNIAEKCTNDYDIVFVIKCGHLTTNALIKIKDKNPSAKFVLYLWDSLERIEGIKSKLKYFDNIYSFDRFDCLKNSNLIFKPLFYRKDFEKIANTDTFSFDLFHLGWFHSDRLEVIHKIKLFCDDNNIKKKLIVFTGIFNYMRLLITYKHARNMYNCFVFKPLTFKKNLDLIQKSKIVLDINHPNQTGLTMRTIEILATGRKLITTNKDIMNYKFYNSSQILVINRYNPKIELDFFKKPLKINDLKDFTDYRIDNWVKSMFD